MGGILHHGSLRYINPKPIGSGEEYGGIILVDPQLIAGEDKLQPVKQPRAGKGGEAQLPCIGGGGAHGDMPLIKGIHSFGHKGAGRYLLLVLPAHDVRYLRHNVCKWHIKAAGCADIVSGALKGHGAYAKGQLRGVHSPVAGDEYLVRIAPYVHTVQQSAVNIEYKAFYHWYLLQRV